MHKLSKSVGLTFLSKMTSESSQMLSSFVSAHAYHWLSKLKPSRFGSNKCFCSMRSTLVRGLGFEELDLFTRAFFYRFPRLCWGLRNRNLKLWSFRGDLGNHCINLTWTVKYLRIEESWPSNPVKCSRWKLQSEHPPSKRCSGWWVSTPLKNMKVSWDDDIPNIWENKKCSKPPTSVDWQVQESQLVTVPGWQFGPFFCQLPAVQWKIDSKTCWQIPHVRGFHKEWYSHL